MTRSAERELVLVDTSVAVPLVVADHEHHEAVSGQVGRAVLGLAGHALFETYSVLTRLPPPVRRTPADARQILVRGFPESRFLDPARQPEWLDRFAALGIAGGSVYDALVAAAAIDHQLPLWTRDRRSLDAYRSLGVAVRYIVE